MDTEQRIPGTCLTRKGAASATPAAAASATPSTPSKGGPPARNQNRTTHAIFGIGLPRGTSHIAQRLNTLRRELAALVEVEHGEVSLYHAAVIDAAVKWERLGQLAGRWLRKEGDKLEPAEKLAFAKEIARAAVERNRAMAALGIARKTAFDPASIYDTPAWPAPDSQDAVAGDTVPQGESQPTAASEASNAAVGSEAAA